MNRGSNHRGRGASRGSPRGNHPGGRGRGRGRGRGGPRGGRGRGAPRFDEFDLPILQWPDNEPPSMRGTNTPRARGRGRSPDTNSSYTSHIPGRESDNDRGRGRGRGRGGHFAGPYEHGRGRSRRGNVVFRPNIPLSKLLEEDRPLLKPIVFVRSVYTATLFQEEEDILQPIVEPVDDDERSHVPTADQITRIFGGDEEANGDSSSSEEEEQLEEIDFTDIGKLQAEVDAAAAASAFLSDKQQTTSITEVTTTEEKFTGFYVDTTPAQRQEEAIMVDRVEGVLGEDDEEVIVYVAPHPRSSNARSLAPDPPSTQAHEHLTTSIVTGTTITQISVAEKGPSETSLCHIPESLPASSSPPPLTTSSLTLGDSIQPGDPVQTRDRDSAMTGDRSKAEVSVTTGDLAVIKEPAITEASIKVGPTAPSAPPLPAAPSFDSISFSFGQTPRKQQSKKIFPVGGPRSLLKRSKVRRRSTRGFGSYGAMMSEAHLRDGIPERDPRESEQRRGDSDVNWGDSDSDEEKGNVAQDALDELSNGMAGMDLDEDIDLDAMKRFVHSMSAEGAQHTTMDDVADIERMRTEDEEEGMGGSADDSDDDHDIRSDEDAEVERAFKAEERALVGEVDEQGGEYGAKQEDARDNGDEGEEEESWDEEHTPNTWFQTKLAKMRANAKGKHRATERDDSSDEAMSVQMTWSDKDDNRFGNIEEIPKEGQYLRQVPHNKRAKRYARKQSEANQNSDFDGDEYKVMMEPAPRAKDKDVPPELRERWEKDRQKKAENKRKRAEERRKLAADPLSVHEGGKKGRKAVLAAAKLNGTEEVPNRTIDLAALVQQIRRFLADIGGEDTMALPPADKGTRVKVHKLAAAFNLKSESKGKGEARYTTLVKTTKSGIGINEKRIKRIMKGTDNFQAWFGSDTTKSKNPTSLAKHREGEEVGKAAPKIGESNVGFKMLAAMGWAEGDRIGLTGGLDAPLTAIMKKTKLGLGATL